MGTTERARAAKKDSRGRREPGNGMKRGPRDINDVSWAVGMFFSLSVVISFFFLLTKICRYY